MPTRNPGLSDSVIGSAAIQVSEKRPPPRPRRATPGPPAPGVPVELQGPEWELILRIAASRGFVRSSLLTNFLIFVARRALAGEAASINEEQIGVHVFGRKEAFNRSDDNIVRNYARMLRKRIDQYFLQEGRDERLRVRIPRGGYVPVFGEPEAVATDAPAANPPHEPEPAEPASGSAAASAPASAPSWRPGLPSLASLIALSFLIGFACARIMPWQWLHPESQADRLTRAFWQTMFAQDRDTFIVPSDGGLVILHRFVEQPTTLSEYISGAYRRLEVVAKGLQTLTGTTSIPVLEHKVETLGDRRYTSIVDLDLTSRISRRREVVPERLLIRYARDLRMDDLKASNAILIGSIDANPWVELFQPQLNFQFVEGGSFGGSSTIINRQPSPGEQASYASITGDPTQKTYGIIAYLQNLSSTGHVLLVEGINMAGTQAAGEFLLNPADMQPVLQRAMTPDGQVRSFEILLETSSIAANSSQPKVLSERFVQP